MLLSSAYSRQKYSHIVLCQLNEKYIGREKKSKLQLEQHLNINQTLDFSWVLSNTAYIACLLLPCLGGPSRSVLRAADWYLGPSSAASGIYLTCSPEHYLFCFSRVRILPSPPVHIPHPMLTTLAAICITPNPNPTPSRTGFSFCYGIYNTSCC